MFTVITIAYWKLPLLKQTIESVLNQTYRNIELIIVNNGASKEIISYITKIKKQDERVVIINYEENIFSWDDPELYSFVCCNDALKAAKGDYIFFTSYDDPLSLDYVERMVRLFENNPNCTTAAGRPVSIDIDSNPNEEELSNRKSNFRPTYMPGHILALETLKGSNRVFSAPGTIFTIKRDVFLKYGGFHRAIEWSQLYGIVPFGETGFDEDAIYYWRRHEGQLNKALTRRGCSGFADHMDMLNDNEILNRWKVHGDKTAEYVVKRIIQIQCGATASHTITNALSFRIQAAAHNVKEAHGKMWYWVMLGKEVFIARPRRLVMRPPITNILKTLVRFIDKQIPSIKYRSNAFNRLTTRCRGGKAAPPTALSQQ